MLKIISFLSLVLGCYSSSAPFITPCKPGDSACLIASANSAIAAFADGVPALGIKPIDPLQIPLIKSDHAGLKLVFRDSTLTGLKNCNVESVKHDAAKQKQSITLKCSAVLTGKYTLDGKLLILPVQGNGPFSIEIRDVVIKAIMDLATVTGKDGLPHWHIAKWRHSYKVLTGAKFDFQKLFNGNKALSEPVIEFANNQWRDVMAEVAPPVVEAMVSELIAQVENMYAAVPASELA
ncbi:circadian clock-controlled protein daywake-like [Pararge aegeria]|uniref:Jg2020 protein n=1 Tax=Pararge aegeria aegeria TaxID=348720 RepID=A0A8S4S9J8_9NEOP|nr:circadian clock-controlled protein daywake-like [Pararge aegeria]CAH2252418.1 jg2020 [Pararge aegeria aegeria]